MPLRPETGKGPVSKLDSKQQRDVLAALVDGNSERGVCRQVGIARETAASVVAYFEPPANRVALDPGGNRTRGA